MGVPLSTSSRRAQEIRSIRSPRRNRGFPDPGAPITGTSSTYGFQTKAPTASFTPTKRPGASAKRTSTLAKLRSVYPALVAKIAGDRTRATQAAVISSEIIGSSAVELGRRGGGTVLPGAAGLADNSGVAVLPRRLSFRPPGRPGAGDALLPFT